MREWAEGGERRSILLIGIIAVIVVIAVVAAVGVFSSGSSGGEFSAAFLTSTMSPKVGDTVTFTDNSTGNPVSWEWDFGDNATSTEQNPSHRYSAAGTYTVKLKVSWSGGATDTAETQITVIEVVIPTEGYMVYDDAGIAAGEPADVWVWSGADWGLEGGTTDGNYVTADAPSGQTVFKATSGSGSGNYIGWGVFLGIFDSSHHLITAHTVDLSAYDHLEFWVKTPVDLKVELQQDDAQGKKATARFISNYGWDRGRPDVWQKVTIPASAIANVDLSKIFSPFMITGTGSGITFYVDAVMWVPPS